MAQFARPSADVSVGSWTNQADAATNLWQSLDEVDASETDFVQASLTANSDYEFRLSTQQAGIIKRGYALRYRGRKNQAAGNTRGIIVELRQGATVIASNTHADLTVVWLDGIITLTVAQANQITNYADLRVRLRATGTVSGAAAVRRRPQVSWAQLRVPDWQPTWEADWGADEDTSTPGVVRLTLNGITAEGPDSEQARVALAQAIRDSRAIDPANFDLSDPNSPYYADDPVARVWTEIRFPVAYFRRKVAIYTELGILAKQNSCQTEVDRLTLRERE